MKKGTIVLTRFPFTDFTSEKRRPAVVISADNENKNDVIIAFISSVIPAKFQFTDLLLAQDDNYFTVTGLHKTSVIRLDKIMTVEKELITGEIGYVSAKLITEIDNKLKLVFGLLE